MTEERSNTQKVKAVAIYIPKASKTRIGHKNDVMSKSYRLLNMEDERGDLIEVIIGPEPLLDWQSLRSYLCIKGHPPVSDDSYWKNLREELIKPISKEFNLVSKLGYHQGVYLDSRGCVFGKDTSMCRLAPELNLKDIHEDSHGTLDEWKENVAAFAKHSDRMMLCLCASLSGALLYFADIESGAFHLHGRTSKGKTTIFFVAGSVCGSPRFVRNWLSTETAIEEEASLHNDNVLLLDEIKLLEDSCKNAGALATLVQKLVYLLSSGTGKQRAVSYQNEALSWRVVYLSNGEKSLETIAREGGSNRMGGSEVRCIDIPCNTDSEWGVFDSLPEGFSKSSVLAKHVERQAKKYFGTAKPAFVKGLLKLESKQPGYVRTNIDLHMEKFMGKCNLDLSDGQAVRIAKRFALTYAAGAIAVELGVLDFSKAQIGRAILSLYKISTKERPLSPEEALKNAHNRVKKSFRRKHLIDLTVKNRVLSDAKVKSALGFIVNFRGKEVFAVTRRQFEAQIGRTDLASQLINRYIAKGILLSGKNEVYTFQPPGGAAGKRLPRCFFLVPALLK